MNDDNIKAGKLVPAVYKKDDLYTKFAEVIYSEDFYYYAGYAYCHEIPEIRAADDTFQWAYVSNSGEVIGYFAYKLDQSADSVHSMGLISFQKGHIGFLRAVFDLIEQLVKDHARVEWRVIAGNPVVKDYDKFCKAHNGNRVTLHNVCKGFDGTLRDEHIYEILNHGDISNAKRERVCRSQKDD